MQLQQVNIVTNMACIEQPEYEFWCDARAKASALAIAHGAAIVIVLAYKYRVIASFSQDHCRTLAGDRKVLSMFDDEGKERVQG